MGNGLGFMNSIHVEKIMNKYAYIQKAILNGAAGY